jgi:3-phosphoshikimate 1-carboxyvinyltransferase
MKWRVLPSKLSGVIDVPPSKSHTIRALLVATLSGGASKIIRPLMSGDGASAINAAKSMGAKVEEKGDTLLITGIGNTYDLGTDDLDMGNSGTSTNLFASVAALGKRTRRFDGDGSLRLRPVKPLLIALQQLGAHYKCEAAGRDLPFTIKGPLKGGSATVNGISSQFVSSLLLSCPLIPSDTTINVVDLHEKPYVEITLWWLDRLGIRYEKSDDLTRFHIFGGQQYRPIDMRIPADFSSATFPAVAAAITGSAITIQGTDFSDPQGDKKVFDVLAEMGVVLRKEKTSVVVEGASYFSGREIDLNAMPDALPALAVLGCLAGNTTHIVNVAQARIKETDRIVVMTRELKKMGARIQEEKDGVTVHRSDLTGAHVNGHGDHRVVMALALAGMAAKGETIIDTAESAAVTYPGFLEDFSKLGAKIYKIEE